MKERIVAIFTRKPISEIKKMKINKVPVPKIKIHKLQLAILFKPNNLNVFCIALGEASKQVIVVLNIVVKAAIAINRKVSFPKEFV